ncbi:MAG: ABC transporter ATP-binding protein [Candidatus Babeliales bacterium]
MVQPLLSLKNIKKKYGSFEALKGVSLDFYPGEVVGLLGVNGAGKTTLSSIIATLHPPTSGEVAYNGHSIANDIPAFRKLIGYCPQKPNLNPLLTIYDNLWFAGKYYGMSNQEIENRIKELNTHLGINKFLHSYSDQLSGGWKQRYMIARTLMHSPKIVILDEPTVGLDPDIRQQLWQYITFLKKSGVCVLLTTHYLDEAEKLSDRVVVLHQGKISLIDTPQNLMTSFQKGKLEDVFLELTKEQKD